MSNIISLAHSKLCKSCSNGILEKVEVQHCYVDNLTLLYQPGMTTKYALEQMNFYATVLSILNYLLLIRVAVHTVSHGSPLG